MSDADEKLTEFEKYYYLYEYTDEPHPAVSSIQYPDLSNYVKTGILTEDEMKEALKLG